jgi:hypothetical protein
MSPELKRVISPEAKWRYIERIQAEAQDAETNQRVLFSTAIALIPAIPLILFAAVCVGAI